MAAAVAVVAGISGWMAGSAAATAIGGGVMGVMGGVVAGAVVGGAVGAAGYAIIGKDPADGLKAGIISGGLAGGLAGWGAMGSGEGAAAGAGEGTAGASVEAGTGNIASSAIEAGTGRIAGSGALATGGGTPGAGLLIQGPVGQIPNPSIGVVPATPPPDGGGFLKNMFSSGATPEGGGPIPGFFGAPMSETMKAATVTGGMQLGGSMLAGYGQGELLEDRWKHQEKLRKERLGRINNLSPENIIKYGSLYKSKYV